MTMPLDRIKELLKPIPDWMPGEPAGTRYEYWNLSTSEVIRFGESAIHHLQDGVAFTPEEIIEIRYCLARRARHLRFQDRPRFGQPDIKLYTREIVELEQVLQEFNHTLHPPKVHRLPRPKPQPVPAPRRSFFSRLLRRSSTAGASL